MADPAGRSELESAFGRGLVFGLLVLSGSIFSQLGALCIAIPLQLISFGSCLLLFGLLPLVTFIFVRLIRHVSQILSVCGEQAVTNSTMSTPLTFTLPCLPASCNWALRRSAFSARFHLKVFTRVKMVEQVLIVRDGAVLLSELIEHCLRPIKIEHVVRNHPRLDKADPAM